MEEGGEVGAWRFTLDAVFFYYCLLPHYELEVGCWELTAESWTLIAVRCLGWKLGGGG